MFSRNQFSLLLRFLYCLRLKYFFNCLCEATAILFLFVVMMLNLTDLEGGGICPFIIGVVFKKI